MYAGTTRLPVNTISVDFVLLSYSQTPGLIWGPVKKSMMKTLGKCMKELPFMKEGYERDFLRYLQSLLAEVERRIRRGHARLALSQAQQAAGQGPGGPVGKNEEKAQVLTEKIEDLVMQIEELGSEGRVEEAQGMMKLVEQLKDERELLSSTPSTIESFAAQEKQMEVCEVCGAFLIVGDAQSRVDDHLMGKQHMGYAKIKSTVEELKEKLRRRSEDPVGEDKGELERKDREREREEREMKRKLEEEEKEKEKEKEREREREKERERAKEREREREREKRGRRSHSNSRHSSRASDRKKSRSRERRRSRSKERERERKRSRSRDRERERERERRRSRERSDRKRRSRSRERKRSRSSERSERKSHRHRSRSRDKEREKDRTSRDKERKEPEERRSSSKIDKTSDDDKSSTAVVKAEPMGTEGSKAPVSALGLALLAKVNGAAQDDLYSEGDTQSN
ncbi:LOW QUALITY PROTEIN: luc7-like protein 3 [Esox lucius]|uniref:LOW QUALITY PROTEIN: luc7-like protein 3 n=1 Tax=Esox lucius TaxID=8010 RepID=UPI0014777D34|nr:LOW QUALITY PROTEIN: luc7-like protein 3 [Esox lucius]